MTKWYNVDCRNTHKDDSTKKKNIDRGKAIPKPTIKLLETYLHLPRNEYNLIIRFKEQNTCRYAVCKVLAHIGYT